MTTRRSAPTSTVFVIAALAAALVLPTMAAAVRRGRV